MLAQRSPRLMSMASLVDRQKHPVMFLDLDFEYSHGVMAEPIQFFQVH